MNHPILMDEAKRIIPLREFAEWMRTEDGLRAQALEVGYLRAKKIGLLKALDAAREGNAERLWKSVLAMAQDLCHSEGPIWEKKAQELAEAEMLDLGYFPPSWTLEQRELYAGELHANNLEEQRRWENE